MRVFQKSMDNTDNKNDNKREIIFFIIFYQCFAVQNYTLKLRLRCDRELWTVDLFAT